MASKSKGCRIYKTFRNFTFVLIFGVLFSLLGMTYAYGESTPIFYTVKIPHIRDDIALHIRKGDTVIDPAGKYNIGRISDIRFNASVVESYSAEKNEMVLSEYNGYSDVYITISAKGEYDGSKFKIGAYSLHHGKQVPLRLPDFCGVGVCTKIGGKEFDSP